MFVFLMVVIAIGWGFSWYMESPVILYVAVFLAIIMNITSFWYSDKIVIKMSGARPVDRNSHRELWNIVENLSITAGLPMPKLFIVDDPAPNAFATGRNPEHAVVAVTSGILGMLSRVELEGVIAHELSHVGNRDMLVSTVVVVLVGVVVLLADFFFRIAFWGGLGGRDSDRGGGQARLIMIGVALVFMILAPIAAQVIKSAISRKREFLADASGALLTRHPDGLARALEKISADPHQLKSATDALSHLYIASPFRGKEEKSWMHKLFMSHPPTKERVALLRSQKA